MKRLNSGPDSAQDDGEQPLSDAEIEAILERESDTAPESNLPVQPIPVVMREPGQGRFGSWVVWLLIAFILLSVWQSIR